MLKKTSLKMVLQVIIGALLGGGFTLFLIAFSENGLPDFLTKTIDFLKFNSAYLYLFLLVVIYIPSLLLYLKSRKMFIKFDKLTDEEIEDSERTTYHLFDIALTCNASFGILNLIVFGITFAHQMNYKWVIVLLFLLNSILSSATEVTAFRFVQKLDPRLKGDPSTLSFAKDYMNSCDEAEKFKIYQAGFNAFQTTKWLSFILLMLTILTNFVFETGAYPIVLTGLIILVCNFTYSLNVNK